MNRPLSHDGSIASFAFAAHGFFLKGLPTLGYRLPSFAPLYQLDGYSHQ
ncbi:hypothetical protein [Nostoc sp.]